MLGSAPVVVPLSRTEYLYFNGSVDGGFIQVSAMNEITGWVERAAVAR